MKSFSFKVIRRWNWVSLCYLLQVSINMPTPTLPQHGNAMMLCRKSAHASLLSYETQLNEKCSARDMQFIRFVIKATLCNFCQFVATTDWDNTNCKITVKLQATSASWLSLLCIIQQCTRVKISCISGYTSSQDCSSKTFQFIELKHVFFYYFVNS